jgi:hypothetical protein
MLETTVLVVWCRTRFHLLAIFNGREKDGVE